MNYIHEFDWYLFEYDPHRDLHIVDPALLMYVHNFICYRIKAKEPPLEDTKTFFYPIWCEEEEPPHYFFVIYFQEEESFAKALLKHQRF